MNANNQVSTAGFTFDGAGNETHDVTSAYVWNAESEIKTGGGINYTYDGDGDRVEKSNGKIYWYGAGSEILDESGGSGNFTNEYVFFGGKRIAMRNVSTGVIYYYAEDLLGSSRALATSTGTLCYDADFFPFGGEHDYTSSCAQNYKFEGKERDAETDNDDFDARYYSSTYGRFLSADWSAVPAPVPYANLTNPQTLNLYAMVSDNPESFADLDGHSRGPAPYLGACSLGDANCGDETTSASAPEETQAQQNAQGQTQEQAQQQNQSDGTAKARATEAGEAALNLTLAKVKLGAAIDTAATAETGAGAVATAYLVISAAGNLVAGTAQSIGAATGKTEATETAAEAVSTVTTFVGFGTLVATGGNLNKAATAAAVEGIVTSNPRDLATGGTVARAAKAIDLMQNIHQVEQKVKNWF